MLTRQQIRSLGTRLLKSGGISLTQVVRPHQSTRRERYDLGSNIIIFRPDGIGDLLLCSGVFREIRRAYGRATLTLVTSSASFELARRCPYVDSILSLPNALYDPRASVFQKMRIASAFGRKLLGGCSPTAAINLRYDCDDTFSTFAMANTGAPLRIAFSEHVTRRKSTLNRNFDRLLTHALKDTATVAHELSRSISILSFAGIEVADPRPELWGTSQDEAAATAVHSEVSEGSKLSLGAICLSAGERKRQWPVEKYAEVAERLAADRQILWLLLGPARDRSLHALFAQNYSGRVFSMAGKLAIPSLGFLLRKCDIFIGPDSGLAHLAAIAGAPVVVTSCHPIHGAAASNNSPDRFRPIGSRVAVIQPRIPRPPCFEECMANEPHCICEITTLEVERMAREVMFKG